MNIASVAIVLATALVSGVVGYSLGQPDSAAAVTVHGAQAAPVGKTSTSPPPAAPLIAVASDGNVTLRIDQQPLEWVLEQIALQAGDAKVRGGAAAIEPPSPMEPSCRELARVGRIEPETLLQEIERGTEEQRVQGLLDARFAGVVVPDEKLKTLFETDASDRVRLQAFESYLERQSGDNAVLRRTLEAAVLIPSSAIQREARARLAELSDTERIDASSNQRAGS